MAALWPGLSSDLMKSSSDNLIEREVQGEVIFPLVWEV